MDVLRLYTENEILNEIRDAVRSRRIAVGYTQAEAARRAGVSPCTVHNFETKGVIALHNLIKLLFVYCMERKIADAFADRDWWKLDEVMRAEKKVRVRNGQRA
jgi:DNA-binding XRE family transcriptional regulator